MPEQKTTAKQSKAARMRLRRAKKRRRIICRSLLSVLTALGIVVVALLAAGFVAFRGPSQSFGDLLTVTMLETSALKFVPRIYYSEETVNEILERNTVLAPDEETDTSLITIDSEAAAATDGNTEEIEVIEVSGSTFRGYMMIVHDPSRVIVGVCDKKFDGSAGLRLHQIAERYHATAAINGGGFEDDGGTGNGGMPRGVVISEGKVMNKSGGNKYRLLIGFDADNKLILGDKMSVSKAKELGIRDAVMFGPALVVNGEPCQVSGASSGLNPRSAIGQRADGAVLLLVIDGRTANSLGATLADEINLMLEYGAVNAANLDGGSSSMMYYNGEYVNKGVVLTGSRRLPDAFVVR